ncbi:MAG: GNAT family N-acetyltransferase [Ardenticatenaceae bacterium]|nr:GNAT family N-acetyltransferase [Ardenticatenaceae bacterium]MCB9444535.1 GNAT family N-acetyltransferase [Ardenticatenaceae bacterium]
MSRIVELKAHDPEWLRQFESEAERLTAVFQPNLVAIHHVGSTAVPGIKAKPIIDILVVVHNIEWVDTMNEAMNQLGYIAKGENGIDGRRYFRKGSNIHHTHHIHTYQNGHPEIIRHLNFRDYLIAHPDVAQAYSRLKEDLASKYKADPPLYTDSKTDFIRDVNEKAIVWHSHQSIETERLVLLPLTMAQLQTSLGDPAQLAQELGVSLADDLFAGAVRQPIEKKLEIMTGLAAADHPWATYWLIIPKEMAVGAGLAGFKGYPNKKGEVEIGYGMQPAFQNKGYMTEAVAALLDWALARPECTAVTAETESNNQPSIRVLQKVGMRLMGEGNGRLQWRKE